MKRLLIVLIIILSLFMASCGKLKDNSKTSNQKENETVIKDNKETIEDMDSIMNDIDSMMNDVNKEDINIDMR